MEIEIFFLTCYQSLRKQLLSKQNISSPTVCSTRYKDGHLGLTNLGSCMSSVTLRFVMVLVSCSSLLIDLSVWPQGCQGEEI